MGGVPWVVRLVVQPVVQIVQMWVPLVVEKEALVLRAVKVVQEEMKEGQRVAQVPPVLR